MKINPYKYKYPFIVIEGIDGCGKSTLIEGIKKWDKKHGVGSIFTKEPTDGEIGQKIRKILNNGGYDDKEKIVIDTELQGLYIRDRRGHRKSEAALLESYSVISDRDFVSTFAYGMAEGVDSQWIFSGHEFILGEYFFVPDLILILDLPAEDAINRLKKSDKGLDYFEKLEFLKKVRDVYLAFPGLIDEIYPDADLPCAFIRASQSPEKVLEDSLFWVNKCFQKKLKAI